MPVVESVLMLDRDLVQEVLVSALSTGAEFAELYAEERRSTSARLDDGRVEDLSSGLDRGCGIRVLIGDTTSYAYSNRLDRDALFRAAETAAAAAR